MDANRYARLTDAGLNRLHSARRKYGRTVEDIIRERDTPSANTVKKALRKDPVFVSTLERVWAYLTRCAAARQETLVPLQEGNDYLFEAQTVAAKAAQSQNEERSGTESAAPPMGWLSRQVPRPNRLFTGREDVLEKLHAALSADAPGSGADPQALTGLGGVGKTQTAIAYIYRYRCDYRRIFYLNAQSAQTLTDGLAAIAEELNLLEAKTAPREDALAKIHDWFRNASGWLLTLDNADDLETLSAHFPRHHGGRLLLTTRTTNTVRWAAPLPLIRFERDEGALLLLRRAGRLDINQSLADAPSEAAAEAAALSDELGGLPLAITQAGAHLAETFRSVGDYRRLYQKQGLKLLDIRSDFDHAPVTITFRLAVNQLMQRSVHGAAAAEMVRLCAFLDPEAIPETALAHGLGADSETLDALCAAVCGYSLAARNADDRTLSVHRLVQKATQETLTPQERRLWRERAVRAVAAATPDVDFDNWRLCDLLLPHWRLCAVYISDDDLATPEAMHLLYQAARYLRARAQYEEAETLLRQALSIAGGVAPPADGARADYLDELGCLYRETGRAAEAEPLHLRAVEITEAVKGPDHPETASKLHNLALFYLEQHDYAQAEPLFLRSLTIRERNPGEHELLRAATLTQLGGVYRYQGVLDKGEPYYRRALAIYENALAPNHIDIATACNNLGLLCVNAGQFAEAETLFLRSLAINEEMRGNDHPETGTVVWSLAWARWKQERIADAERLFQRAIQIYTNRFGQEHHRVTRLLAHYDTFQKEIAQSQSVGGMGDEVMG